MPNQVDEHLIEVRYKPNPKVLDYRGAWARAISDLMELQHWRIDTNRIDIRDDDASHNAFVSFKNAGFVIRNAPTRNYFSDQSIKFLKILFQLKGFEDEPFIERIGIRLKVCTPFDGEFSELVKMYSEKFMLLSEPAKDVLESKLIDIGSPLVLESKIAKINLMGGPMSSAQIAQFFPSAHSLCESPPNVGLAFDIDYWSAPQENMNERDLTETVKVYSRSCWSMNDRLKSLILN